MGPAGISRRSRKEHIMKFAERAVIVSLTILTLSGKIADLTQLA